MTSVCMRRICWISESFRYNVNGFVEELPQLPENRWGHSCAAIPSTGVRLILFQSYQLLNPVQEYIIAGGRIGSDTLSVLSLLPGASSWTTLASLPRTVYQGRASLVGGNMRLAGGSTRDQVRINNLPGWCRSDMPIPCKNVVEWNFLLHFQKLLESHYSRCLNISPDHPANGSKLELFKCSDITLQLFPSELKCCPAWQVGYSFPSQVISYRQYIFFRLSAQRISVEYLFVFFSEQCSICSWRKQFFIHEK